MFKQMWVIALYHQEAGKAAQQSLKEVVCQSKPHVVLLSSSFGFGCAQATRNLPPSKSLR
jgi:hypothetical protein